MYYKIYRDNEILDAISNPFYFYRLPNRRITSCSRKEAEGVLSQDGSTKWFIEAWIKQNFVQNACSIIEITANEYELLREALDQKKVVEDTEGEAIIVFAVTLPRRDAVATATSIAALTLEISPRILTHAPHFKRLRSTP